MRIVRRGRILDPVMDDIFPNQVDGKRLSRFSDDNYICARNANVDCTTTHHTLTTYTYDDGTPTTRWVSVAGRSLPLYVNNVGWQFTANNAIRSNYAIASSVEQFSARVVIPEPYFPVDVIPRQWCLANAEQDVAGKTISGTGIRWGNLYWGVGHYQIRCCPQSLVEQSACLILVVGSNVQYHYPFWGNVSEVDLTIQRVSSTQARVIATSSAGTFQLVISQSLSYSNPYQAEYFLQQVSLGCTAPAPIAPYTIKRLQSPNIQYTYTLPLDTQQLATPIYLQIKSLPDEYVAPVINVHLQLEIKEDEYLDIPYQYNSDTNLWHSKEPVVLDGVVSATFTTTTNHILERVSVLMGGAVLHYVPAPHQVEWMAVVPVEMEQTGIPSGIIPLNYDVLGISDYTRVLDDGTIAVLPAQHARVITMHLRERLQSV